VLFIPLVSAHTQARHEGYFRLEWDMAAERARSIASGVAFILPVVIDDTREPDALVPDRFRTVQWTRLPGGVVPPDVQTRLLKLWSHRTGVLQHATSRADAGVVPGESRAATRRRPPWLVPVMVGILAVSALAIWRPWRKAGQTSGSDPGPPTSAALTVSPAHQLADKARALFENQAATSDDFTLAEDYCKQALKLDSNDAYVWAIYAELSSEMIGSHLDVSAERRELARTQAERAVKLAPDASEARFAKASYLRRIPGPTVGEAEKILRELLAQPPADPRVLIALAKIVGQNTEDNEHLAEALALLDRAAAFPACRAWALDVRAFQLLLRGRNAEAEAAIDESLAIRITKNALVKKVWLACLRGDLAMAQANLAKLSGEDLRGDQGAFVAARTWLWSRNPAKCLEVLAPINRDYLSSTYFSGPTDLLRGQAYHMAGKSQAARIAWQTALEVVDKRLAEQHSDADLLYNRAYLLALLGRPEEATVALQLCDELNLSRDSRHERLWLLVNLKTPDLALDRLEQLLQEGSQLIFRSINLQLDPGLDPLRDHPRFKALLARDEAGRQPRASAAKPAGNEVAAPAVSPAPDQSIAVLAFANMSAEKDTEYFSDGVSEEILNALANNPGLRVAARTSSFSFKGKNATAEEIGRALHVAHVIEGSVRRAGNQVRITVQLINTTDGYHAWSETFTKDLTDIFAVQSEIAAKVAQRLSGNSAPSVVPVVSSAAAATKNPAAYDAYLRARAIQTGAQTAADSSEVVRLYQEAARLDPGFALPWARLSQVFEGKLPGFSDRSSDTEAKARDAAATALRLDPNSPEAHLAMSMARLSVDHDPQAAQRELDEAVRLRPNDPEAPWIQARLDFAAGRLGEPLASLILRAADLDPQNGATLSTMGGLLTNMGRFADAERLLARSLAVSPMARAAIDRQANNHLAWTGDVSGALEILATVPANLRGANYLFAHTEASLRAAQGDFTGAAAIYEQGRLLAAQSEPQTSGTRDAYVLATFRLAQLEARLGHQARAAQLLDEVLADARRFTREFPDEFRLLNYLSLVHAVRGEKAEALVASNEAARVGARLNMFGASLRARIAKGEMRALLGETDAAVAELRALHDAGWGLGYRLRREIEWEPLRGDAKFQQLMKEAEARADAQPRPQQPR